MNNMKKLLSILILCFCFSSFIQGKVKLPAMMGDHMILQQNSNAEVQWTDPSKKDYKDFLRRVPHLVAVYIYVVDRIGCAISA